MIQKSLQPPIGDVYIQKNENRFIKTILMMIINVKIKYAY